MNDTNYQNPIDQLFDEENCEPIVLFNEKGEAVAFEQIAVIPQKDKVYAILKPIQPMEGMGEDEGLVFSVEENDAGEGYLALTTDEGIINAVFEVYDRLVAEHAEEE